MTERPSTNAWPLEPPEAVLREWFGETLEELYRHVRTLPDQPAAGVDGALEQAKNLSAAIGEEPGDARALIRTLIRDYVPRSFNTAGPGYMAYIPGGGIVAAGLADLISNLTNRFVGVFAAAPLLARLETIALRWLLDEMGYPEAARGVFLSGGSMANLMAVVCARHKILGSEFLDGIVYCSEQVHHSVRKAVSFAGFPERSLRLVGCAADGTLAAQAVKEALEEDRRQGLRPALLVASAGTVNTGVADPLDELGALARREGIWFHVDAAYGGFFQLTERGRAVFRGIERSDSITIDPHKGLFLPYGTGCLLVRDGEDLRRPNATRADYLPAMQADPRAQDSCEYSPELSRDFRGLRVWLPLKIFGAGAFRACLDEKLDLARHAAKEIRGIEQIELLHEPPLSLVAFRMRGDDPAGTRTQKLLARITASGRVWLSGTRVNGTFVIRICVLSFRTHKDRVDELLEILRREVKTV